MSQAELLSPSPVFLPPLTYKGTPVVTTAMLADAYGCSAKNIRDNFASNRERFIEGKHFYALANGELQAFRDCTESFGAVVPARARNLTLWLEHGAARHAKMLNTALAWDARVVSIADGDTITILTSDKQRIKVRLYGIDCPERRQPFGRRARETTSNSVAGKVVDVRPMDRDRYGRTVAVVTIPGGETLQEMLLESGMAWVYPQIL